MRQNGKGHTKGADVLKGLAAGVIGGLVASVAMNQFQALWSKLSGDEGGQGGAGEGEEEPSTVKTAEAISENVLGHHLKKNEKETAGEAVHYAFGSTMGALYGVASELWPQARVGAGIAFGTAVWLGADEAALPLLGLSKPPDEYPPSKHVYALASHFVYGLATEASRRVLRGTLLR